ncbi:MAG TPA: hypothetical protein DEA05_05820 [Rhodobacteraceae bacterium]|nr:hypothetical protein [Paracoccaceae bacterium]
MALAGCARTDFTPTVPQALEVGEAQSIFAATTRAQEQDGKFGFRRSPGLSFLELTVAIPPDRRPGSLKFGYKDPDPATEFTMARRDVIADANAFRSEIRRALPPGQREINVFVHGYNATQSETAFRAAQLVHDLKVPGVTVIYSWPSRGRALGYAYDNDSMLFARDGLEELLRLLAGAGYGRVNLIAHSLGSALAVETLRQIDLETPGWPARNLGGVLLMSPDVDVDVFRAQMRSLSRVPKPFVILVSREDRALSISATLRGDNKRRRLGTLDNVELVSDLPIEIIDVTAFSRDAESSHFVAASSPSLIALLGNTRALDRTFSPESRSPLEPLAPLAASVVQVREATQVMLAPDGPVR